MPPPLFFQIALGCIYTPNPTIQTSQVQSSPFPLPSHCRLINQPRIVMMALYFGPGPIIVVFVNWKWNGMAVGQMCVWYYMFIHVYYYASSNKCFINRATGVRTKGIINCQPRKIEFACQRVSTAGTMEAAVLLISHTNIINNNGCSLDSIWWLPGCANKRQSPARVPRHKGNFLRFALMPRCI